MKSSSMNVSLLVIDYVVICEKRRQFLDFTEFVDLWMIANEIAEEEVSRHLGEAPQSLSPSAPRSRG